MRRREGGGRGRKSSGWGREREAKERKTKAEAVTVKDAGTWKGQLVQTTNGNNYFVKFSKNSIVAARGSNRDVVYLG
jgi:hypothetical protein